MRVFDPYDLAASKQAIAEEVAKEEPSLLIARRPCVLLKQVKTKPALKINKDKCVGCGLCMKIGCPSMSMRDKKAGIDFTTCLGCGVCRQMCKVGAIGD